MGEMLIQCPYCGGQIKIAYNSDDNIYNIWHSDRTGVWFDEPVKILCELRHDPQIGELRYDPQIEVWEAMRRAAKQWLC